MSSRIKSPILLLFTLFLAVTIVWAQDPSGRPTKEKDKEKSNKSKVERPKTPRTPVTVAPPTVLLTVMTEPPESEIYINGSKRGETNNEGKVMFEKMPLAQYTVEVRKAGFRNATKQFTAGTDSPTLVFKLEPDLDAPTKEFDALIASGALLGNAQPNALTLVNDLSAKYPNHPEVVRMRGVLAAKLSDTIRPVETNTVTGWRKVSREELAKAAEAAAKASELKGEDARAKSEAAYFRAILALRDWQMGTNTDGLTTAKSELQRITASDATFAPAFYQLGMVLIISNELGGAESALQTASRLEPHWAATYAGLGWVYYGTGRYREAIDAYRKATTEDPTLASAYAGLGLARVNKGEKDGVKDFDKAKLVDPSSALPYYYYGLYLSQSKKSKELGVAESELKIAIQKNANNLEFQNSKAQQLIDEILKRRKK